MEWSDKQIAILNVAEDLFSKKGFDGTSVRHIAEKAGVNVAMISYYFGSKERLLHSLIKDRTAKTRDLLAGLLQDTKLTSWEKMDQIVDRYVDVILDNRHFHNIIDRQISMSKNKKIAELVTNIKEENGNLIAGIIAEGQRKKVFRKINIGLIIGTILGTISQFSMSKPFYSQMLGIKMKDEKSYASEIKPRLKTHLKSLLRAYLSINNEKG